MSHSCLVVAVGGLGGVGDGGGADLDDLDGGGSGVGGDGPGLDGGGVRVDVAGLEAPLLLGEPHLGLDGGSLLREGDLDGLGEVGGAGVEAGLVSIPEIC